MQLINRLTIYQYMSAFLIILTLTSVFFYDFGISSLIPVLISVLAAAILDFAITYFKFREFEFPYSALISGLLIGGLLTQGLPWYTYVSACIIAVASKHLIKVHGKHIFNPANFGILLVFIIFSSYNSWWISSPLILVLIFGIFLLWRLKRFDLAISFIAAYYIFHALMMSNMPMMMGNFYRSFANQSTIFFFAMFMLIEPRTNPAAKKQRIFYGILVALMYIGIERYNPAFGLPFVLAVANLIVPLLNRISFEFRKKNIQAASS